MNNLHLKAIELKYEGKTYIEISDMLDGNFTVGTLKQYFSEDGMLFIPYKEYETEANNQRLDESIRIFKKNATQASQALVEGLERAVTTKNDRMIIRYASAILDRAGLVVSRNSKETEEKETNRFETYEEYVNYCVSHNIDPKTGLRKV